MGPTQLVDLPWLTGWRKGGRLGYELAYRAEPLSLEGMLTEDTNS